MKQKKYIIGTVMAIVIIFFADTADPVRAQSVGIKISPVKIKEIVDPGEILSRSITVTNEAPTAKIFFAYLRDFKAGDESGTAVVIAPGSEPGPYLSSWVDITGEGIEFAPGEEKTIDFKINVPSNQGPGGYYGAIVFGSEPPKLHVSSEDKGAAMTISQQTGALILLQVRGDVMEEANIREFSTDKDFYSTPFSVKFLIRIENLGNVHLNPVGEIAINNMFGKEVAKLAFNSKGANILPKSIRRFEDFWAGNNGFGRYTANLAISFGTSASEGGKGKQTLAYIKTFWILPWKIIIPGLIGAILIGVLLFLFLNFYKTKAVRQAMEMMGLGQVRYIRKYEGPSPAFHLAIIVSSLLFGLFLLGVVVFFIFFA